MLATLAPARLPDRPLTEWAFEDARSAVAVRATVGGTLDTDAYETNAAYVEAKDHWQGGAEWIGPGANPPNSAILDKVAPQFTPVDVVGEVLDRAASALLKRPPTLDVVPVVPPRVTEGEAPPVDAVQVALRDALSGWVTRAKLADAAESVIRRSRWAARAVFRVFVPAGALVDVAVTDAAGKAVRDGTGDPVMTRGLPTNLALADALDRVEVEAPLPHTAAVFTDPRTRRPVGVLLFRTSDGEDGRDAAEVWTVEAPDTARAAVGLHGPTLCRVLVEGEKPEDATELRLDLGGRIPLVELDGKLLLTEPIIRLQRQCNFANSCLSRNAEVNAFPERTIINAAPHGTWVRGVPDGAEVLDTKEVPGPGGKPITLSLVATARTIGSSTTTELVGIPTVDEVTGKESRTAPAIVYRDPSPPDHLIKQVEHARAMILWGCKQGHAIAADVAQRSGFSIVQARAEFEDDATKAAGPFARAYGEVGTLALCYGRLMTQGRPEAERPDLAKYRVTATVHVDTGPRSADEERADSEKVQAGTMSLRRALVRDGVQDVDAEIREIQQQPMQQVALSQAKATAFQAWTTGGAGLEAAGELAQLSDDEMKTLTTNAGVAPGLSDPTP